MRQLFCKRIPGYARFQIMPARDNSVLIEAKNISLTHLWKGLGFKVCAGEMLQIIGANGAGKTSLIRILCGLVRPDRGQVLWLRRNIYQHAEEYHSEIAYVGHKDGIKDDLTPVENLVFAAAIRNRGHAAFGDNGAVTAEDALQQWGMAGIIAPCRVLSAGQRRRTALARLLLFGACLWFLDEPLTALDNAGKQTLGDIIADHLRIGGAVVMSSHQEIDWPLSSRILSLHAR